MRGEDETQFALPRLADGLGDYLGRSGLTQGAKTTPSFYIVLNSLTKRCSVFDKTPKTDTPNITVASDAIYKTRADAEAAMNKLRSCNR
jgi:hypothetical protein